MSTNVRGKKTQSEILDAAWELVSRDGADVLVSDIARTVGVSRQTIYMHFGSRGGLLVALVRRADDRLEIRKNLKLAFGISDPRVRLDTAISVWLSFVPQIYPVAKDLIRLRETDKDSALAWEDRMSELRSWLLELTQSLHRDGCLLEHWSAEDASAFLWAQSSVQMWGLLVNDCGWPEEKAVRKIQKVVAAGLLNPS